MRLSSVPGEAHGKGAANMRVIQHGAKYYFANFTHKEFWFHRNCEDIVFDYYLGSPPENYRVRFLPGMDV